MQDIKDIHQWFKDKWESAVITEESEDDSDAKKQKVDEYRFNKMRLNNAMRQDIEDDLKELFYGSKQNVYRLLLDLIENNKVRVHAENSKLFLGQTFHSWLNQQRNRMLRKTYPHGQHLASTCTDSNCNCQLDDDLVRQAFSIATLSVSLKNMLGVLNKIFNFKDNISKLEPTVTKCIEQLNLENKAFLLGELHLQDRVDFREFVITLFLLDKPELVDDFIGKDDKYSISVVALCNELCDLNLNLKEFAIKNYPHIRNKKLDKFKAKFLSKYALSVLKRLNKQHLIYSTYNNIDLQAKLTQLRYFISLKFEKASYESISNDAWVEILVDITSSDDSLKVKLIDDLIRYRKDIDSACRFIEAFGDNFLKNKIPLEQQNELYCQRYSRFAPAALSSSCITSSQLPNDKYHFPSDKLNNDVIKFIANEKLLEEMLNEFEQTKPDCIGMDCEWKPTFGPDVEDNLAVAVTEATLNNDPALTTMAATSVIKNNGAAIFQISTRDKVYIIDVKNLIPALQDSLLERFSSVILFNENLLKLGYSFDQDATRLYHNFSSKLQHNFSLFTEQVINIDQVVEEFQKNWPLFDENDSDKTKKRQSKGLSELTRRCFGKPLDKSECLSNWEKRPLRQDQLRYAALDAFVLVQIHDFIQERAKKLNITFDYSSTKYIL